MLLSAIANWQAKNEDATIEDADLFVKEIRVDGGGMLKRLTTSSTRDVHTELENAPITLLWC